MHFSAPPLSYFHPLAPAPSDLSKSVLVHKYQNYSHEVGTSDQTSCYLRLAGRKKHIAAILECEGHKWNWKYSHDWSKKKDQFEALRKKIYDDGETNTVNQR